MRMLASMLFFVGVCAHSPLALASAFEFKELRGDILATIRFASDTVPYASPASVATDILELRFTPAGDAIFGLGTENLLPGSSLSLTDELVGDYWGLGGISGGVGDLATLTVRRSTTSVDFGFHDYPVADFIDDGSGHLRTGHWQEIPEPSTMVLLATGLMGAIGLSRRRMRA